MEIVLAWPSSSAKKASGQPPPRTIVGERRPPLPSARVSETSFLNGNANHLAWSARLAAAAGPLAATERVDRKAQATLYLALPSASLPLSQLRTPCQEKNKREMWSNWGDHNRRWDIMLEGGERTILFVSLPPTSHWSRRTVRGP